MNTKERLAVLAGAARYALRHAVTSDARYKRNPQTHCGACYEWLLRDGEVGKHKPGCPVPGWEKALEPRGRA